MRASLRDLLRAVALAGCALCAPIAAADAPGATDLRAEADADFIEAKALMNAGQTSAACPKFARSEELDPRLGRLLNLAFCHEQEGRTASAWREYLDATTLAEQRGQAEREDFAREHASALARRLSLVRFDVPPNATAMTVDGAEIERDQWSAPMPLDPGRHTVALMAPGKKPLSATLVVAAAPGTKLFTLAPLPDDTEPPPPALQPVREASGEGGGRRGSLVPAYVAGGAAILGLAAGAGFGLDAMSKKGAADQHCPDKVCDPTGAQLVAQARSAATASTVSFGTAGACAIAALWLLLRGIPGTDDGGPSVTAAVDAHAAGIGVGGRW